MAFNDVPLMGMLKTRMRWLETRQKMLAENVANAETPGYKQRDLKTLDFPQLLAGGQGAATTGTSRTHPLHIAFTGVEPSFGAGREATFETTPDGNSVVLEDEMLKVAETQQDFQLATMLYSKSMSLLKLAVRRG
jgi:flagellar basal-body rod protein FlgB